MKLCTIFFLIFKQPEKFFSFAFYDSSLHSPDLD